MGTVVADAREAWIARRSSPRFTVVVACLNQERYVTTTLDSVRHQTENDVQLVITDDGSSDLTTDLIRSWIATYRPDATLIAHSERMGVCATLNEALSVATGDLVAFIAGDDIWLPHRLSSHRLAFDDPAVGVAYSDVEVIDSEGRPAASSYLRDILGIAEPPAGDLFNRLAASNPIPAMGATVRLAALRSVGGFDESLVFEDWDAWLRLAAAGWAFSYVPAIVGSYRRGVPGSLTTEAFIKPSPERAASVARLLQRQAGKSEEADAAMKPVLLAALREAQGKDPNALASRVLQRAARVRRRIQLARIRRRDA